MNMTVQTCCRDQHKMEQVVDQMKLLAHNLDELRSEISTLKTDCSKKDDNISQPIANMKNNVLRKVKRYMKKVTSIHSLRNGRRSDSQEAYYSCANSDAPVPSFLNYILRIGKRGDVWQIPTRVKYLRNESNQTDEELEDRAKNLENRSQFTNHESTQPDNKVFSKKYVTVAPQYSDISCELDSRVETPISSTVNLPSDLSTTETKASSKHSSHNMEAFPKNDSDKRFTATSTQTSTGKLRKNRKITKFHPRQPNLYFSKIKNAVITKKIIRNSNKSTFTVCRNYYPHSKKKFYGQYPRANEKRSSTENIDEKFSLDRIIEKLNDISSTDDNIAQEEHGSSSSSVSVDLELTVSDSSSKIDEFSERRKPRTYVVRKTSQKRDQNNWSNHFEKSVIYVGPTSDLTLFSSSFLN